jgi:putative endonuclease
MDGPPCPPRRTPAQRLGAAADDLVAERLTAAGWTILGRNVHVHRAELDLIGIDPRPAPMLVVVEVRWRVRRDFGLPEETVDHRKITRIRRAAFAIRDLGALPDGTELPRLPLRIDLVAVEPRDRLRHYRHVG